MFPCYLFRVRKIFNSCGKLMVFADSCSKITVSIGTQRIVFSFITYFLEAIDRKQMFWSNSFYCYLTKSNFYRCIFSRGNTFRAHMSSNNSFYRHWTKCNFFRCTFSSNRFWYFEINSFYCQWTKYIFFAVCFLQVIIFASRCSEIIVNYNFFRCIFSRGNSFREHIASNNSFYYRSTKCNFFSAYFLKL